MQTREISIANLRDTTHSTATYTKTEDELIKE